MVAASWPGGVRNSVALKFLLLFSPRPVVICFFGILRACRAPGGVLVDAISLTYEVTVTAEDEDGPRRCEHLSPAQALDVGLLVGEKVRRIFDIYERRWRHSLKDFNLETPTVSSLPESRRFPPIVFVKCKGVRLRITGDARPSSPLEVWWSSLTSRAAGRPVSSRGVVHVRFEKTPIRHPGSLSLRAYEDLGTPIAPYITSLSAIGQAYSLGLADANDVEVVMKRVSRCSRPRHATAWGGRQ